MMLIGKVEFHCSIDERKMLCRRQRRSSWSDTDFIGEIQMGIEEYKEAMTDYLPSWSGLVVSFSYINAAGNASPRVWWRRVKTKSKNWGVMVIWRSGHVKKRIWKSGLYAITGRRFAIWWMGRIGVMWLHQISACKHEMYYSGNELYRY
jgi:hypothetical protein